MVVLAEKWDIILGGGDDEPGSASGLDPRNIDGEGGVVVYLLPPPAEGEELTIPEGIPVGALVATKAPESKAGAAVPKAAPDPRSVTDQEASRCSKTMRNHVRELMNVEEGDRSREHEEWRDHSRRKRMRRPSWSRSRSRSSRSRSFMYNGSIR